jgi:hypothetical protein
MIPDSSAIRAALCACIAETLQLSGKPVPQFKDPDIPLQDYAGLDSHCGIEITVAVEIALEVADLGNNLFVNGTGKQAKARTLSEIVETVAKIVKKRTGRAA